MVFSGDGCVVSKTYQAKRTCHVCGVEDENIIYTIFKWKYAVQIWGCNKFMDIILSAPSSSFAWAREDKDIVATTLASGFMKFVTDYRTYQAKFNISPSNTTTCSACSACSWTLPHVSCVKINVDAHCYAQIWTCALSIPNLNFNEIGSSKLGLNEVWTQAHIKNKEC